MLPLQQEVTLILAYSLFLTLFATLQGKACGWLLVLKLVLICWSPIHNAAKIYSKRFTFSLQALDGPHSYVIADSGGLLVAIPLNVSEPDTIKFSTDEGRCWHEYKFTNESIHHTGLLTEPGGKSMTVAIWGYTVADKKWTVNVIDFTDVVPKQCKCNIEEFLVENELCEGH